MTTDSIFPIHSVTKTITSVAAMMLVDRGKIALADPVSKYIPSFAGMKVGVERKDEAGRPMLDLVPSRRPVTIEELLLQTGAQLVRLRAQRIAGANGVERAERVAQAAVRRPRPGAGERHFRGRRQRQRLRLCRSGN